MKIHEYQAKEVLRRHKVSVPFGVVIEKKEEGPKAFDEVSKHSPVVVVEHIHEDAKYEEKEKEDGTKEQVEVSPAKEKVKINKRPVSISDITYYFKETGAPKKRNT